MATTQTLLTVAEYLELPDNGQPTELVRGRVVEMNLPYPRHGQICSKVVCIVGNFVEQHELGLVVCNDAGIVTQHDPDSVRGSDVAFYSYNRVPRGPFPTGYLAVVPELIFEVCSPTDRWKAVLAKVVEYLDAGVTLVCVLDDVTETARVYHADQPEQLFASEQDLTLPEVLSEFSVRVARFFE
jgi:Uma2 family endonuclease